MSFRQLILGLLLVSFGCQTEEPKEEEVAEVKVAPVVIETSLKDDTDQLRNRSYLERKYLPLSELHGKFFQDRVEYHILENPDLTLYKTQVTELTFYHIDSELTKKKFIMGGDISGELMAVHGKFKLKPLDSVSLLAARNEAIIQFEAGDRSLNEKITNYEMRWEKSDRTIRYRATPQLEGETAYVYTEEVPDYKFLLQSVQTGIKIHVDPDVIEKEMEKEADQQTGP